MERRSDREVPAFDDALTRPADASAFAASPPLDARVWRADESAIAYRDWGDELVVFHETTGHTHHLGPAGRAVLLLLLERRRGLHTSEIVSVLGSAKAVSAIERTLAELMNLELVVRDPG
jgi:PqqD family protein of HPr-rel-A system